MRFMLLVLDGATALGAIVGALLLISMMGDASAAALALALVGIPYCFSGMLHRSVVRDELKRHRPVE